VTNDKNFKESTYKAGDGLKNSIFVIKPQVVLQTRNPRSANHNTNSPDERTLTLIGFFFALLPATFRLPAGMNKERGPGGSAQPLLKYSSLTAMAAWMARKSRPELTQLKISAALGCAERSRNVA
jgi:hypothetical protein